MLRNIHTWIGSYLKRNFLNTIRGASRKQTPLHILFSICDHYEPYWENRDNQIAYNRVKTWIDEYPKIAEKHLDSLGTSPKHTFFYPAEEYNHQLLNMLGDLCRNGFGEVEIHLHHDNDTAQNLRRTILEYKNILINEHGFLSKNQFTSEFQYGFIHGNWALDNSRPDGRWCGVNNEISILQETGCYADFTMPSAPSNTQTKTINSIYYAIDDPLKPKSHNTGIHAEIGKNNQQGLLCIQGPLCFNLHLRKFGLIPKIENSCIAYDMPVSAERIKLWTGQQIHVQGRPDIIFIKLYTHGTQEKNMKFFFAEQKLDYLFSLMDMLREQDNVTKLYYVTPRQMYNVVKGLESQPNADPPELFDFELALQA